MAVFYDRLESASREDAVPDSVVLANSAAWHDTGTVIDTNGERGVSVPVALEESGLDFQVEKVELFAADGQPVERNYGVQRLDNRDVIGVVGEQWEPMQPAEGFQVLEDLIEQAGGDKVWIESAGVLGGGRKIWVMAHIDTELQIAGEDYRSYLLFTTGFDGRLSTTAAAIDERVVCANTLNFAIYGQAKESGFVVRVRHTKNAGERIKEAHAILGMRNRRAEELAKQGEWLVNHSMDDGEFNNFLETLMPVTEEQEGKPAETMARNRQDAIRQVYFGAENLKPIRGTAWGALQAVLEYADHGRSFKSDESRTAAQLGMTTVGLKQDSFNLAMAFAGK